MSKKKTMVYLTERQHSQLKRHASETGETMAGLIREAVDEFLARERPAVDYMAIVGMFETEPDNVSERVDEVISDYMADEDIHGESEESRKAVEQWKKKQKSKHKKSESKASK